MPRVALPLVVAFVVAGPGADAWAQQPPDLAVASLEELMQIEVTSAFRKEQLAAAAPAAMYVITQDEIRRSGLRSIPELLRLAPGVQVARINSSNWAISVRGFNGAHANKLLVLIDGRATYNGLFSGVYWIAQDLMVEDIDRIEVTRGPGSAIWGANAVNGVINIVTRTSAATLGWLFTSGGGFYNQKDIGIRGGLFDEAEVGIRAGGSLRGVTYRMFSQLSINDGSVDGDSHRSGDAWDRMMNGFRLDWTGSRAQIAMTGGLLTARSNALFAPVDLRPINIPTNFGGVSAHRDITWTGSWLHGATTGLELQVQSSLALRRDNNPLVNDREDIFDIEAQAHRKLGRHDLVGGGGYRRFKGTQTPLGTVSLVPPDSRTVVTGVFARDEIAIGGRVKVTIASRIDHATHGGWGVQPTARVQWQIIGPSRQSHLVWASWSRARRTPSMIDLAGTQITRAFVDAGGTPTLLGIVGNPAYGVEAVRDVEAGYRWALGRVDLDLSVFRARHDGIRTYEPLPPLFRETPGLPHVYRRLLPSNLLDVDTSGVDVSGRWTPGSFWRLDAWYSGLRTTPRPDPSTRDAAAAVFDGEAPQHQWKVGSTLSLGGRTELGTWVYHASRLRSTGIPEYTRVDARLSFQLTDELSLNLTAQNATDPAHAEFSGVNTLLTATQVPRSLSINFVRRSR